MIEYLIAASADTNAVDKVRTATTIPNTQTRACAEERVVAAVIVILTSYHQDGWAPLHVLCKRKLVIDDAPFIQLLSTGLLLAVLFCARVIACVRAGHAQTLLIAIVITRRSNERGQGGSFDERRRISTPLHCSKESC